MLTVTEKAQEQISAFFKGREAKPIRIFLTNGCGGPQIAMGLDEATDQDSVFEFSGIQYLVEKTLLDQAKPIEIDFGVDGFKITSSLELGAACGGCGSTSNCCGH